MLCYIFLMLKKVFLLSVTALVCAVSYPAAACVFSSAGVFKPDLERSRKADESAREEIPAPAVTVVNVIRREIVDVPLGSCDDAGVIELEIKLPQNSTYTVGDFGIYFRVKGAAQAQDKIFPNIPFALKYRHDSKDDLPAELLPDVTEEPNDKAGMIFAWLDDLPGDQIPLNLEIEAFFITDSLNIGPSTVFRICRNCDGGGDS